MDILIADDSESSRVLLKTILNKLDFNVVEAFDGLDAWNKLNQPNPPRIAIFDWLMPEFSGIDLTVKIREQEKKSNNYTYIIMITSNTANQFSSEGFNAGVDDFLVKPIDREQLSITLKIAERIIKIQTKLSFQLSQKQKEIKRAQEIQTILNTPILPQSEEVNLQAVYNPSQEMGGDFFNIIKTARGNMATLLVDCTGHGLEASMYATLLKSVCDRHLYLLDNPHYLANFIQMVNIDIAGYITSDQFPVMFASVYSPESGKFYYSSANGEHPYLIRQGETYPLARCYGMHLGYNTESQYTIKSFEVKNNDIILFYSDAIIEINGASWSRSNDAILREELSRMGSNLTSDNINLMRFIKENSGSTILNDDLTLVYMQIKKPIKTFYNIYNIKELHSTLESIGKELHSFDYSKNQIERVIIAIKEILLNSFVHGNREDETLKILLSASIDCEKLLFSVEDEGKGFNEKNIPDPTDLSRLEKLLEDNNEKEYTHGRGIWLARKLIESVTYKKNGSEAVLKATKDPVETYNNYTPPIDNKQR